MARQAVKAMCSPLYEDLQDSESGNGKRQYFNCVKEAKLARVELVENVSNRPDFNLKKLTHPFRCKHHERIMCRDPFEMAH